MWWWRGCGLSLIVMVFGAVPGQATSVGTSPATVLIEAATGEVLSSERADDSHDPGDLSQLMVLLLALERSSLEEFSLDVPVSISATASAGSTPPRIGAQVPLKTDRAYLLSDLMKATLISSAETAALAVAEAIAGTVPLCVEAMNERAAMLGMTSSHFGGIGSARTTALPDRSSARDLARLARALIAHPQVLAWSSLKGMPFDHGTVLLRNNNAMLGAVRGVDGLQISNVAGRPALIATAQRNALRLIAVVLDAPDHASAYRSATDLLESGFTRFQRVEVVRQGERMKVSVAVSDGGVDNIVPVAADSFSVLRRGNQARRLVVRYQLPERVTAPVHEGDRIGELIIEEAGHLLAVIPLISPTEVHSAKLLSVASLGS